MKMMKMNRGALYHYAMYIQDDENPRASSELAIAVKPSYEGRLENEISEAVSKGSIDRFYWGYFIMITKEIVKELSHSLV